MDPNCLHCRIGALLKTYLEEKRDAGNDDDRRVDNVLEDLVQVVTDVLDQVPDPRTRLHLGLSAVEEIMRHAPLEAVVTAFSDDVKVKH